MKIIVIDGHIFKNDENNIYIDIALIEQEIFVIHPIYCLIIFIFKDKYTLIM